MVVALYLSCQMVEILCWMLSRSSDSLIFGRFQKSETGRSLARVEDAAFLVSL